MAFENSVCVFEPLQCLLKKAFATAVVVKNGAIVVVNDGAKEISVDVSVVVVDDGAASVAEDVALVVVGAAVVV